MVLQLGGGLRRTGERYDILTGQVIEKIPCRAGDELEGARWQHVGFDHNAEGMLGEYAVALAGFTIDGTPASNVGASFSSMPQTGKLNALI